MRKLHKSKFDDNIGEEWIYLTIGQAVNACNFMLHACKNNHKVVEAEDNNIVWIINNQKKENDLVSFIIKDSSYLWELDSLENETRFICIDQLMKTDQIIRVRLKTSRIYLFTINVNYFLMLFDDFECWYQIRILFQFSS